MRYFFIRIGQALCILTYLGCTAYIWLSSTQFRPNAIDAASDIYARQIMQHVSAEAAAAISRR